MSDVSEVDVDLARALNEGRCGEPFSVLGPHGLVIRSLQPRATNVSVVTEAGERLPMTRTDGGDLFTITLDQPAGRYQLEIERADGHREEIIDPYSLPSLLGDIDRHLFGEGTHQQLYRILGSHLREFAGVEGVHFAVWAPNASRVSVVGTFNEWDGRTHVMRAHPGSGIWDIFVPGIGEGTLYKYEILDRNGQLLPLKHDPFADYFEQPPGNASIVFRSRFIWSDGDYLEERRHKDALTQPINIYEVHAGSWRRNLHGNSLTYRELAETLIPYVRENGYTHIEFMPITEHPFDGSWGYQPIGLYAPSSRFGSPDDFRHFVDAAHARGIGVIMDWVPAHFPTDAHGLGLFDGTHLYEHADPRQGMHQDWNTLIYNFGRREVANYLLSNAVYWIREFHLDGLRVDAVASMLYLDYSRNEGEWVPNQFGGRENLEAIDFLRRMNELVHAEGGITFAEESTSFPQVSHPVYNGGLGFTFKWNMGWMHDILDYMHRDPAYRKYHHNDLTFGLVYAFSENFTLPFSHDEVVYGKGSMINKMPGDDWQKFANLRTLYAMMSSYPGKKLNFMGNEIAQYEEWSHDDSIRWDLLKERKHFGVQRLVRDLNFLYKHRPALHRADCSADGFAWIDCEDADHSVISWYRHDRESGDAIVTICNFTPVVRHGYRIGVDEPGTYIELINTDANDYGGSGQGNLGTLETENEPCHDRPVSLSLTLPPLATLILCRSA